MSNEYVAIHKETGDLFVFYFNRDHAYQWAFETGRPVTECPPDTIFVGDAATMFKGQTLDQISDQLTVLGTL